MNNQAWQPYADKIVTAVEQYAPEAWEALVSYNYKIGLILSFTAVLTTVIASALLWIGAKNFFAYCSPETDDIKNEPLALFGFVGGFGFFVCSVVTLYAGVPRIIEPVGYTLMQVLGK